MTILIVEDGSGVRWGCIQYGQGYLVLAKETDILKANEVEIARMASYAMGLGLYEEIHTSPKNVH